MTETLIQPIEAIEIVPYQDTDDGKQHLTHIVNPTDNPHLDGPGVTAKDLVGMARLLGEEIVALCGYKWIPVRNPEKYPVCKTCLVIAGHLMREAGE